MQGLIPNNAGLNGATIPRQSLLVPYPQFSGLALNNLPIGRQRYDGLQTRLTKRFSHGLTFVSSYVFSKTLEQLNLLNTQDLDPVECGSHTAREEVGNRDRRAAQVHFRRSMGAAGRQGEIVWIEPPRFRGSDRGWMAAERQSRPAERLGD